MKTPVRFLAAALAVNTAAALLVCAPRAALAQDKAAASPTPAPSLSPAEKKGLAADVAEVKTADQLWSYIEEWANKEPVLDDALDDTAREKKITDFVESERARLNPACEEFLKLYPKDPRRWDVRLVQLSLQQEGETPDPAGMEKTLRKSPAPRMRVRRAGKRHVRLCWASTSRRWLRPG